MFIVNGISNCVGSAYRWAGARLDRAVESCARSLRRVPAVAPDPGATKLTQRTVSAADEPLTSMHRRVSSDALSGEAFSRSHDAKGEAVGDGPASLSADGPPRVVFHAPHEAAPSCTLPLSAATEGKASKPPVDPAVIASTMQDYVKSKLRTEVLCAKSFLRGNPDALTQVADYLKPRLGGRLRDIAAQVLRGCLQTGARPSSDRMSADFSFDIALYRVVKEIFQDLNPDAFDEAAVALVRTIGKDLQQQIQADRAENGNSPNDYGDLDRHGAVRFAIERIAFRLLAEALRSDTSVAVDSVTRMRIASTFQAATNRALDFARLGDAYFTRPAPGAEKVLNEAGRQAVAPVVRAHAEASQAVFDYFAEMLEPESAARQQGPAVLYS